MKNGCCFKTLKYRLPFQGFDPASNMADKDHIIVFDWIKYKKSHLKPVAYQQDFSE